MSPSGGLNCYSFATPNSGRPGLVRYSVDFGKVRKQLDGRNGRTVLIACTS
jgi:hypothetical protein